MEARDLNDMYRDALADANEYVEIGEKIKELRDKRKQIEEKIQTQLGRAWKKLEDIKSDIKVDRVRMTDVALNDLMKGETVSVKDQYDNEYEPIWTVKFKKVS